MEILLALVIGIDRFSSASEAPKKVNGWERYVDTCYEIDQNNIIEPTANLLYLFRTKCSRGTIWGHYQLQNLKLGSLSVYQKLYNYILTKNDKRILNCEHR